MAITGAHVLLYTSEPEKLRELLRDAFGWKHVDAGHGWLIFALPPGEVAAHPAQGGAPGKIELYLMCEDVKKTVRDLTARGVKFTAPISSQAWGLLTTFELPGAGEMSLYQPKHPLAHEAKKKPAKKKPPTKKK